ncbi:MAG TPA: hypothetical protein VGC97_09890 [Pyrinomonadaceae bacterium]|jgi:hypothetical protein
MNFTKRIITFVFAIVLLTGVTALSASAQRRSGVRIVQRPVIVRTYGYNRPNPFWYRNYYWNNRYFYDPYLREREQRYYLEQELSGNKKELRKHLEKYNADGVLTAKEREELADDYRDVEKAQRQVNEFNRRY